MRRYQSHKVVEAAKIVRWESHDSPQGGARLHFADGEWEDVSDDWIGRHHPPHPQRLEGGYFVRYPDSDGYSSWSPAGPFEEGYHAIEPAA